MDLADFTFFQFQTEPWAKLLVKVYTKSQNMYVLGEFYVKCLVPKIMRANGKWRNMKENQKLPTVLKD